MIFKSMPNKQGQTIYDNGIATHLIDGKEVNRHEYLVIKSDGTRHYIYDEVINNFELSVVSEEIK